MGMSCPRAAPIATKIRPAAINLSATILDSEVAIFLHAVGALSSPFPLIRSAMPEAMMSMPPHEMLPGNPPCDESSTVSSQNRSSSI